MENEQLLQELSKSTPPAPAIAPSDFETFFQRLITLEDPDQIISTLIAEVSRANGNVPTIYLKFLPAYQSLAITASAKIPHDQVFSVGIKLDRHDPREVPEFLENPATFKELHELMREVFHCEGFSALPLRSEGGPQGIIVVFTKNASPSTSAMVVGASLQFNSVVLNSKLKEVTIKDFLTGLYNRRYFMERVDEEVSRCYRTHYPLSFIHLDIDDFNTYSVVNGPIMADIVLKTVSQIISKTGRKIDAAVRWGASEFGVLCPNTPGVGAAIKAEKMRITIESTKFPLSDKQPLGKITISVGVSEYPTLASDSTMLLKSAANALFQVKQGGKNRVCLAEAPSGFKPDFEPLPVPGFKKIQQSLNQTAF
jgi:diguanylate cyclase (GGDEF)-like protein